MYNEKPNYPTDKVGQKDDKFINICNDVVVNEKYLTGKKGREFDYDFHKEVKIPIVTTIDSYYENQPDTTDKELWYSGRYIAGRRKSQKEKD